MARGARERERKLGGRRFSSVPEAVRGGKPVLRELPDPGGKAERRLRGLSRRPIPAYASLRRVRSCDRGKLSTDRVPRDQLRDSRSTLNAPPVSSAGSGRVTKTPPQ